jgi:hypothetical protein
MRSTIIFLSILFFLVFVASGLYSQYCYMQFRELLPRRQPVGLLTGLRPLEFMHDPNDPNLSDECRIYYKRFKVAGMLAILAMVLIFLFILVVRLFGLAEVLDQ